MQSEQVKIAILNYNGALMSSVLGIGDLFGFADRLNAGTARTQFCVDILEGAPKSAQQYDAIILPSAQDVPDLNANLGLVTWLRAQHSRGSVICSACAGVFWLAETGLLDGRSATTHWALEQRIARSYPKILLNVNQILIEHTDVITAGGMMAWMDLCLLLIERFAGGATAAATARHFVIDPCRQDQRRYKRFLPDLSHDDAAIRRAQHDMESHFAQTKTVVDMASDAGLAPRTFLRRFTRATGHSPKDYIQHLRIEKARDILLQTTRSISNVAYDVGYQDQTAFSRVFQKIAGETPSAFRAHYKRSPARPLTDQAEI